jgi:polyketide cyclase/dehydrase/lipid transport protein
MKTSAPILVIVAIPLVVIGGELAIGVDAAVVHRVFLFAVLACVVATTTVTFAASARKPDLSRGIDEQAITRYGVLVGSSAALGLGALSFALATGWPWIGLACAAVGGAWFMLWLPPSLRLMTSRCSIDINRDLPPVFALMSDFRTMVRWYPGVEQVEMLTPEPIGPGTRFRGSGRLPSGGPVVGVDQIVDFEPNRRYSSTTLSAMKNLDVVTFEAVGTATRVSLRSDVELQFWMALLGVALFKSSLARSTVALREAGWAKAKQLLESHEEATT